MDPTPIERALLRLTIGRSFNRVVSRVVRRPRPGRPAHRRVRRHGLEWDLDLAELVQWHTFWGWRDPSHDALIALARPGARVVDVGANIGVTSLRLAAAVGSTGRVLAFEPDPASAARLRQHVLLNRCENVDVVEVAIGRAAGTATLVQPSATNRGMGRLADSGTGEAVAVSTLDDEVPPGSPPIGLVKIDTEGNEVEVLCGGAEMIRRDRPSLFVEADDGNLHARGSSARELVELLRDWDYDIETVAGRRGHADLCCRALAPPKEQDSVTLLAP